MGNDHFDASIGLAFSLAAFERYKKTGLLQAELHHVPGIRGRCQGLVEIQQGKVVACFIEGKDGQRHLAQKSMLIQLDEERGPFAWTLIPVSPTEQTAQLPRHEANSPTFRIVGLLNLDKLHGWSPEHKHIIFQVYQAIDGQRTLEHLKQALPFPPYLTEEALHVLFTLKVIEQN